jgi:hypothetical protein
MNRTSKLSTTAFALLVACVFSAGAQAPPNGQHPWQHGQHANGAPPNGAAPAGAAPAGAAMTGHAPAATGVPQPSSAYSTVPVKKTESGEQFFIVASLDLQKQQLLLKYPTEVTLLVKATDQTKFVDDSGNAMKLSDFRAGDTVWLTSGKTSDGAVALKVRKGQMTVADLHRYYLDYAEIK